MTRKQMNEAKKTLPPVMNYAEWTDEQKKLDRELMCREMINSILIYQGINAVTDKNSYNYKEYLKHYEKELGVKTLDRLISEQVEDFKQAETFWLPNSYDFDGGPYKAIVWADEKSA